MITKLKASATVIALIVVAAVGFAYLGNGNAEPQPTASPGGDSYMISVKWHPSVMPIHSDVIIVVTVSGWPSGPRHKVRVSPYGETLVVPAGSWIQVTATSLHPATEYLDCIILKNGRSVLSTGFDSIKHAGTVKCSV